MRHDQVGPRYRRPRARRSMPRRSMSLANAFVVHLLLGQRELRDTRCRRDGEMVKRLTHWHGDAWRGHGPITPAREENAQGSARSRGPDLARRRGETIPPPPGRDSCGCRLTKRHRRPAMERRMRPMTTNRSQSQETRLGRSRLRAKIRWTRAPLS